MVKNRSGFTGRNRVKGMIMRSNSRKTVAAGSRKPLLLILLACVLGISCLLPAACLAWEQDEHMEINRQAYEKFLLLYSGSDKFVNSAVDRNLKMPGPYTTSASLFESGNGADAAAAAAGILIPGVGKAKTLAGLAGYSVNFADYEVETQYHTLLEWVMRGGYSADEPEIYASVRHFYDPTEAGAHPEITDQEYFHGFYDKAVPALEWAYTHPENAFSFTNGLLYYKKAMEIAEDGRQPSVITRQGGDGSFRDLDFTPESAEQARRFYLGKAFRALGESMHMISDMAMPAHTRNDSHPYYDSIETPLVPAVISASARYNAQPEVDLSGTPMQNFVTLAKYTNEHFFSNETIYDAKLGVTPWNDEKRYPKPQLSDLTKIEDKDKITYYQTFSEYPFFVPMAVQSKSTLLGLFGSKLSIGFSVPAEFGPGYCDKLVPLAIKASYRTMYDFFPTLKLSVGGEEEDVTLEERDLGYLKKVVLSSSLLHDVENDPAWVEAKLQVKYSGPGTLYRLSKGKRTKIADVIYRDGIMTQINTSASPDDFSAVDGPVVLYAAGENTKAVPTRDFPDSLDIKNFLIMSGDTVSIEVLAGGRKITCDPYVYVQKGAEVVIQPPRIVTYELLNGAESAEHTFEAVARPEGTYRFDWDFGDGTSDETTGVKSTVKHTYTVPGEFHPEVILYSNETGDTLSSDQITLMVLHETATATEDPGASNKTFRIAYTHGEITYETLIDPQTMIGYSLGNAGDFLISFKDSVISLQIPAMSLTVTYDDPAMAEKYAESGTRPPERHIQLTAAAITAAFSHETGSKNEYGYRRIYDISKGSIKLAVEHYNWRKNYPNDPDIYYDTWDLSYDGEITLYEHGSLIIYMVVSGTYRNKVQGPFASGNEEIRELKDVPLQFSMDLVRNQ
jgi:hypothetical protein